MPKLNDYLMHRADAEQQAIREAEEIINILTGEEAVENDRPEESN